ncbi:LacI family DNA-binding transcriptional regulator [Nocardioides pantholopis]|uniref:LacI family DNA-binding transcriptional regulator n=1 Tax=Nocardioides pantholopis TaxID=2483798 RepID=UPI000F090934|nr:LacI family DNA-binding transcriptional regulator [Nocardioides pantholopis]
MGARAERVRLRDVAARAGVSVKTVSNVVNGYQHVSPATRAKVQAVLDETGYRPNLSARNLRVGRTGLIALALPELDNPYFAELAGFVVQAAAERGWTVLVDQTEGEREREQAVASGFPHHLIDGLILSPLALDARDLDERGPAAIPLVLLGERLTTGSADHVAIDNVAAARVATEHLIAQGRTRIAALGHQPEDGARSGVAHLRRRGWAEALRHAGLPVDDRHLGEVSSFGREQGASAMAALLDRGTRPDGVLCFNDTLALGALRVLADRGIRVPHDVAVVGIDDVAEGRWSVPRLTSVAPDKEGIARSAVRMLAERLEPGGSELPPRDVRAGFELRVRESSHASPTVP